jgi:drug/metabolite transporter (DMT)-like permease
LGVYFLLKYRDPEAHKQKQEQAVLEGKQLDFNKLKIAIPALCDCLASTLQLFALNFTAGSIYQMMRGGTIVTTFLFSVILLKLKPKRYQMLGSLLAFVGIGVVGTTAMVFADP